MTSNERSNSIAQKIRMDLKETMGFLYVYIEHNTL